MAAVATSLYLRPTTDADGADDPLRSPLQPEREPAASRTLDGLSFAPADLRKPLGLPPRSTSLGSTPADSTSLGSTPADSTSLGSTPVDSTSLDSTPVGSEPKVSVYSTNGTVYERAAVVGHSLGTDGVVYYLLEVRSWESPLEGYVVRRRYNDFRRFHDALSQWMPPEAGRARSASSASYGAGSLAALGGGFSTLLLACSPIAGMTTPELSPLLSPTSTHSRRRSVSGDHPASVASESTPDAPDEHEEDLKPAPDASVLPYTPRAAMDLRPGATYYDRTAVLPLDEVKFTLTGRARLPELPAGGLLTSAFLTAASRAQLIAHRMARFNRILAAALSDSSPSVAREVMLFVQEKPDALAHTYTSLAEYAAISMPFTVERRARRRAMSMGRQLRDHPSSASDASASPSVGTS